MVVNGRNLRICYKWEEFCILITPPHFPHPPSYCYPICTIICYVLRTNYLSFQQVMQLILVLSLSFASLRGKSHSVLVHKDAKKTAAGKVAILYTGQKRNLFQTGGN